MPDSVYFLSYSIKYVSGFMHLMTSWDLNIWTAKIWLSQEQKELLKLNKKATFSCSKGTNFKHTKQTRKNIAGATFKAYVCSFSFFFFFTKWQPLNNYEKYFLFYLKSSFYCQDIQILVFPSSLLIFPVSHRIRGWWKINLKVNVFSNYLNKNLITNFVWYLGKERRLNFELELCQLTEFKYGTFLWKTNAENVHQKLVLDPFLVLVNNPKQPLHERNCFKNKMLSKSLKKVKSTKIPWLVMYHLT